MNFDGMWMPADQDPRLQEQQATRGERDCVIGYLEHYRETLRLKCSGLDTEQLATRSVPPSNISLLGLVRHMARVEQSWFRRVIGGDAEVPRLFQDDDGGFDFSDPTDELVAQAWTLWEAEVAHGRAVLAEVGFDDLVDVHGDAIEVRDVLVHLVEEYARHCGHADLVREVIDGRTGQ